jgi:hypothetical protein
MIRAPHSPKGGVRKTTFAFDLSVELPGRVEGSTGQRSKTVGKMPRNLLGRGFSAAEGALS